MKPLIPLPCAALLCLTSEGRAQDYQPSASKKPDAPTLKLIDEKTQFLGKMLASLRKQGVGDPWLADAEMYHEAAVRIVQHDEFFQPESAAWTLEALDRGLLRAKFLGEGRMPWGAFVG